MKKQFAFFFSGILSISIIYAQAHWTKMGNFPQTARSFPVSFVIGEKAWAGLGYDGSAYKKSIYRYYPEYDFWEGAGDFLGMPRNMAVSFTIGNKAYVGTGNGTATYSSDFWMYDPSTDSWTQKADLAGDPRHSAIGFSVLGKGYIGLGQAADSMRSDLWEYDPSLNSWTERSPFPGKGRTQAVSFVMDTLAFFATGDNGILQNDFWLYNPTTDDWLRQIDFPGFPRKGAVVLCDGKRAIVGLGSDSTGKLANDMYVFSYNTFGWTPLDSVFPGAPRSGATAFTVGEEMFLAFGYDSMPLKDVWKYAEDPEEPSMVTSDKQANDIRVSPNPIRDYCRIQFPESMSKAGSAGVTLSIFDMNGNCLYRRFCSVPDSIELSGLQWPAGTYLLQLNSSEEQAICKVQIL